MLSYEQFKAVEEIEKEIGRWLDIYRNERRKIVSKGETRSVSAYDLLKRPDIDVNKLKEYGFETPESDYVAEEIDINVKYSGYFERERKMNEKMRYLENIKIPEDIDYPRSCCKT